MGLCCRLSLVPVFRHLVCDTCPMQGPASPRAVLGVPLVPCAATLSPFHVLALCALCVPPHCAATSEPHFCHVTTPVSPVCAAIPGPSCPPSPTSPTPVSPLSPVCCHPLCPVSRVCRHPCALLSLFRVLCATISVSPVCCDPCPLSLCVPRVPLSLYPPRSDPRATCPLCAATRVSSCVTNPVPCPPCPAIPVSPLSCHPCCPASPCHRPRVPPPRASVSLPFPRSSPAPPRVPSLVPVSPARHGAAGGPVPGVHGLRALAGRATPRPGRRRALLPPPALPRLLRARGRPGRGAAGAPSLPLLRCRCVGTAGDERRTRGEGQSQWDSEGTGEQLQGAARDRGWGRDGRSVVGRGLGRGKGEGEGEQLKGTAGAGGRVRK